MLVRRLHEIRRAELHRQRGRADRDLAELAFGGCRIAARAQYGGGELLGEQLRELNCRVVARDGPQIAEPRLRVRQIGRLENLPDPVLDEVNQTLAITAKNDGLQLVLALNYGSRAEIADAVRAIAEKVKAGELDPRDVSEQTIADHLYTADMPDPDLLVRTAGEMRVSNYLLWQISYAEIYVSDVLWPEFREPDLHKAIQSFATRNRRFGALDHTNTL